MPHEMIDVMQSMTSIMEEETSRLRGHERGRDLGELATAKIRLAGKLEELLAKHNRLTPQWPEQMDEETRGAFSDSLAALRAASSDNAGTLERQIELSMEMMTAIANEARRLSGNRTYAYGAQGAVAQTDMATPISFNSEY